MNIVSDKILTIPQNGATSYAGRSREGVFLIFFNQETFEPDASAIMTCRESFFSKYKGEKYFMFSPHAETNNAFKNVEKFWKLIEGKLGRKFRITVFPTNIPNLYVIQPWSGWRESHVSLSLLSLFVRWSFCYYNGDWENSFNLYKYADDTKDAINRFLEGYTKPTFSAFESTGNGYGVGWMGTFHKCPQAQLEKLLVKPE